MGTMTDSSIPGQSAVGSNGNEEVLPTYKISRIGASLSEGV